jgi:hypothetical protein
MKKRNEGVAVFIPLVITISLYVVFNSRIECKPNSAGFWLVLVLGMSIGVTLVSMFQLLKAKDSVKK